MNVSLIIIGAQLMISWGLIGCNSHKLHKASIAPVEFRRSIARTIADLAIGESSYGGGYAVDEHGHVWVQLISNTDQSGESRMWSAAIITRWADGYHVHLRRASKYQLSEGHDYYASRSWWQKAVVVTW